jgi:hypothetical protein
MNDKEVLIEEPRFDAKGMTQWYWRVLHPENLRLGRVYSDRIIYHY